jgi:hypothetical protein
VIGGQDYDEAQVNDCLRLLGTLDDDPTVIVSSTPRGFEAEVCERLENLDFALRVGGKQPWWGSKASDLQATAFCVEADVILVQGNGGRAKAARSWYKRCEGWRDRPQRELIEL